MRNGGIGTYNWLIAHLLAGQGWDVHVLYCGAMPPRRDMQAVSRRLHQAGVNWHCLHDFEPTAELDVEGVTDIVQVYLSERVRHVLEELHGRYRFDLVEFGEWGALGFRCVQAKRAGVAFGDIRLMVRLHSSSQWMREGNRQWLADPNDVEVDYCERYAFEHADVQLSPSRYMFAYARQIGWDVRPDAQVIAYPYPEAEFQPSGPPQATTPELVFFGRLETRKGLEVFVQAVQHLDPHVKVTFLGRVNMLGDGKTALEYIRENLPGRSYKLLTNYNREQALRYLSQGDRLAIIASLSDNSPFTVIECMTNGLPFLASQVGGIPELLADEWFQNRLLFEPNTRDLLRCLRAYLDLPPGDRAELCQATRQAADVARQNATVAEEYRQLLSRGEEEAIALPDGEEPPLVTVAIAYYNLGAYLPETLASLAAQTYRNFEVIVINDGSTDARSKEVYQEQQALYPHFRFLSQDNAGIGATRNRGLAEARGEYFIPMDADNVAGPHMIERFVAAMRRNPDLAAITCFYLAFTDSDDLKSQEYSYAYRPTCGPHILASIKNIYGDANALFRTEVFRSVGGYETDRDSSWEDLEAFVKLVNAGHRIDTLPEYLFFYRHLTTGFSRVTDTYLNQRRVLRQYFQLGNLPLAEGMALWTTLVSLQKRNDALALRLTSLRYRIADQAHALFAAVPHIKKSIKWLLQSSGQAWRFLTLRQPAPPHRERVLDVERAITNPRRSPPRRRGSSPASSSSHTARA
jgi:glycosyltransferase involved in cell wall biosynthesis